MRSNHSRNAQLMQRLIVCCVKCDVPLTRSIPDKLNVNIIEYHINIKFRGGGLSLFPHTTKSEVQVVDLITFRHFEGEIYILEESERHCFYENDHCKFCDFGTKQRCSI